MWDLLSLDVRPNPHSFAAAIGCLRNLSRTELEARLPSFVAKVACWPARARRLQLQDARFIPIAGELSIYCANPQAVAEVLSSARLDNVRRIEVFVPPGPPVRLRSVVEVLPETVTGFSIRGEIADAAAIVAHPWFVGLRDLELRTEGRSGLTRAFIEASQLPELESLSVGPWSSADLSRVLQRPELARLRHLGFEEVDDASEARRLLAHDLQQLDHLCDVRLREWGSGAEAEALATVLRHADLRSLYYARGSSRAPRYQERFERAACHLSSLTMTDDLLLDGLGWMHTDALSHLEEVAIRHARLIGDAAAVELASCELPSLRHLDIEGDDIGVSGATAIIERFADELECFIGSGNPVGDAAVAALSVRGGFLAGVVMLELERCGLSAAAMRRLLGALVENAPRLASLRVVAGNELDTTCLDLLRRLQRRGVHTGSLPRTPQPITSGVRFRPSLAHAHSTNDAVEVSAAWATIDRWLGQNAPQVLRQLAPPLTDEGRTYVAKLASRLEPLGLRVPEALHASWSIHDGTLGEHNTFFAIVPTEPAASWIRSMFWLGAERTAKSHFSMLHLGIDWPVSAIPVAEDGGGNVVFIDTRTQEVAVWDHESGETQSVASSFAALLASVAERMEAGRVSCDEDEELIEASPLPTAPAPDASPRAVATRLLELLVDAELVRLTANGDRGDLIRTLEEALAEPSTKRVRVSLQRVLETHEAIEDYYLDDTALEQLAEEFG